MRRWRSFGRLTTLLVAIAIIGALGWATALAARLEAREIRAAVEAERDERVRLALWRMDSWFAPHLVREAARPYFEYLPFYAPERAYTRLLSPIEEREVLTPSPLLAFRSEFVRLHFQVDAAGVWSSPQAPRGNFRDLAETTGLRSEEVDANERLLGELSSWLTPYALGELAKRSQAALEQCVVLDAASDSSSAAGGQDPLPERDQQRKLQVEQTQRAKSSLVASNSANWIADVPARETATDAPEVEVGPFVPLWPDARSSGDRRWLAFARRVSIGGEDRLQGFLVDWPRLAASLLAEIEDLLPGARLEPRPDPAADGSGMCLTTLPAALVPPPPAVLPHRSIGSLRVALVIAWMAGIGVIVAVGFGLRASLRYAEKRSRFASAVTHELRTPLTTFRMYSEMLARGMISDPIRRREYLETLERESARLAHLIENVLVYARLEGQRAALRREGLELDDLLERVLPALEDRASRSGVVLRVEDPDAGRPWRLTTDPDAVLQILLNLVDNACKYGCVTGNAEVRLSVRRSPDQVTLIVADGGPGIPETIRRTLFEPFERGDVESLERPPGLGLGLALARGLARELGGELSLLPGKGTRFALTLPQG